MQRNESTNQKRTLIHLMLVHDQVIIAQVERNLRFIPNGNIKQRMWRRRLEINYMQEDFVINLEIASTFIVLSVSFCWHWFLELCRTDEFK